MLRHGVAERVPEQRRVEVRVVVDEPRSDDCVTGVELGVAVDRQRRANLDDHAVAHPHVGAHPGAPVPSTTVPPRTTYPLMAVTGG